MRPTALALFVAGLGLFLLTAPPFWQTLAGNIGLAALVAMGLVLLTGVGGMTSFGQAAFMGFGAYTTAVLSARYGVSPWLTLPLSIGVTGLAALILGGLTVRLAGHYLPLGTLAWGLALYYLFGKIDWLGRHDGIVGIPPLSLGSVALTDPAATSAVIWTTVLIAAIATTNLLDSRIGRAIRALRGGGMAQSFGVDRARTKLLVFVYAALLAGLAGWLYAHVQRTVNPTPFGALASMEYLFMAVVGGAGRVWGAVVGAAAVVILKDVLQRVTPALIGQDLQLEAVVFGLVVVGMLQVAREGLWPRLAGLFPSRPPPPVAPAEPDAARRTDAASAEPASRADGDTPLLEVEGAVKRFGGLTAVNRVGFSLRRGEILALIGPNGAGKSTTFNLITGVLPLTEGSVRFAGKSIDRAPPAAIAALGIARTFQHVKLVPEMSVIENVALGGHLRGRAGPVASVLRLDRAEEKRLLGDAARQLERVGLAEHAWKPAGSLALGQQRIVEIARALALDPRLLLLDEPAAGLRHFEKVALADLLARLRAEGMSILLVEHDMGFVMGLVDRIVVLDFGTPIAEGTPEAVRRNPAVVEAYLGGAA